jgi:hypothetical protein
MMTAAVLSKERIGWDTSPSQLVANGLLMVCAWCKKARVEEGRWQRMEPGHVGRKHSDRTSHGICPECVDTLTRELDAAAIPQAA